MVEAHEQVYIAPLAALAWLAKQGIKWTIKKLLKEGLKMEAEDLCAQHFERSTCQIVLTLI